MYRGVKAQTGISAAVLESGLLTDELRARIIASVVGALPDPIDSRTLPDGIESASFGLLQTTRANARQARGALAAYAPTVPSALTGELYAIEGLNDVLLADIYCSGIPLSTVNVDGTFSLRGGSTTTEVYRTAIALFDSAASLSVDSARIHNFALLGKARALVALGEYSAAAAVVAGVPTEYAYTLDGGIGTDQVTGIYNRNTIVSDNEGQRGLAYASSKDPRTLVDVYENPADLTIYRSPLYIARKYDIQGHTPLPLASGVEARLIEAEANLRTGGSDWLTIINTLRTDGTYTTTPRANPQTQADSSAIDTTWGLGTGVVPGQPSGVRPLTDPGVSVATARLDSLLQDRAFWLFLTGHRQGDLRRVARNDRRPQQMLYPSGFYLGGGTYGSDVTIPVPSSEEQGNSKYSGCFSREA